MHKLFEKVEKVGASGVKLPWVVDFDAIPDDVVAEIADIAAPLLPAFGRVAGVPKGTSPKSKGGLDNGRRLETAFRPFLTPGCKTTLIVDDVWMTGGSMEDYAHALNLTPLDWFGFVVYARSELPDMPAVWAFWECGLPKIRKPKW